jgi:ankyrin repeat protein
MQLSRLAQTVACVACVACTKTQGQAPPDPGRLPDPTIHLPSGSEWKVQIEMLAGDPIEHPVLAAVVVGDVDALRAALNAGYSVHTQVPHDGGSLVQLACIYSQSDCLSVLISHGGDVNAIGGRENLTPLINATTSKCHACLSVLLAHGADPNGLGGAPTSRERISPLGNAAAVNDPVAIGVLVKAGAHVDGSVGSVSPLIMAAARCNIEAVHALLAHGANANIASADNSMTPLTASCKAACPSVMSILLGHGANPHGELKDGVTPLMQAAWWGSAECIAVLLKHEPDFLAVDHGGHDAVMNAALRGHDHIVQMLLAAGAKADRANANGWTPLMFASRNGNAACVKTLLDNHADPNVKPNGWTPLKEAARHCHASTLEVLLEGGGDPLFRDQNGWSALDDAARYGCPGCVKILLDTNMFDAEARNKAVENIEESAGHHHISKLRSNAIRNCRTLLQQSVPKVGKDS